MMKTVNSKILTLIFSAMAIFALSGCGSSGTSSSDELVGGTPVAPPVVAPSYEITAHHDSTVVVHSHVTPSPTGDEHTHQWTQLSGPTVALTTPTGQTTTFVAPAPTTQPVVLQHAVTNVQTGQTTVTHHTVTPIPAIPKTQPLSLVVSTHDVSVLSGSKASLHVSVSGGDGQYTYVWRQIKGPKITNYDDHTHPSAPTFTAPSVTKTEDLIFEVLVTDGQGATKSVTETITVTPAPVIPVPPHANTAPVANAGPDQNVVTESVIILSGLGSTDAEGDSLTYKWIMVTEPHLLGCTGKTDLTLVDPEFIPNVAGDYVFRLTVNDGTLDNVPDNVLDTVTIHVTKNPTVDPDLFHNSIQYHTVTSPLSCEKWLDRNLGASQICTSSTDKSCYGDGYQWGRNFDGHEKKFVSAKTDTLATNVSNVGHGKFIYHHSYYKINDWAAAGVDDNGSTRKANWTNTVGSSVCPVGYRVPSRQELNQEMLYETNTTTVFENFLKLPAAGFRDWNGRYLEDGSNGYLWTSNGIERTPNSYDPNYLESNVIALTFNSHVSGTISSKPYNGMSVRCIKD